MVPKLRTPLNDTLREQIRQAHGRAAEPRAASIDRQTVKTTEAGGERGYDGGKKVAGRKRHLLVDTAGNVLTVVVHRANMPDRDGAAFVLEDVTQHWPTLQMVWADHAYTGDLVEEMYQQYGITLEIVAKVAGQQGGVVLPRRWVVERTFAWLGR